MYNSLVYELLYTWRRHRAALDILNTFQHKAGAVAAD
jgi:hypothetical protein